MPAARSTMSIRLRMLVVAMGLALATIAVAAQLLRLGLSGAGEMRTASLEPVARTFARPDIVDRNGRVIATDVAANSLFADPALVLDRDEVAEQLSETLPGIDRDELRRQLADKSRRFVWIRRGLAPVEAQRVHDLGLPGLAFRREPKRVYPVGALVGHIVGQVNPDNRGISGIERHIDERGGAEAVQGAVAVSSVVRLSVDLGVQHAVADELKAAVERFQATGATGLVMDAASGEIIAGASWPPVDPHVPGAHLDAMAPDRLQGGVYELGSIFKALTVAMALDDGLVTLDKSYDVTRPLVLGGYPIRDLHPAGRPLTVRDIFIQSSNVGAAMIAIEAGTSRQLVFMARMGMTEPIRTEAGPVAPPLLPQRWGDVETGTIAYGHGMAVAPLQLAAVMAALVNGGRRVAPTYLARGDKRPDADAEAVLAPATSAALRELMRLNVTMPHGTGRRAEVAGYRVGGKTGTAEIPGKGGYRAKSVISSFIGALPMDEPRYVLMVSLFEPQAADGTKGGITAGLNAAPVTAAIVARIAPILGVLPRGI